MSDPLYRRFTAEHLAARRHRPDATVDKLAALEWLESVEPERWSVTTAERLLSGLLSSAGEAGLCRGQKLPRKLVYPDVSDACLAYLLYLLRGVEFEGTLLQNPYLSSVGLQGSVLHHRLQKLPGLVFHQRADVADIEWARSDLVDWARQR